MGRHFLQIPGPSPEPDAVLRAISATTIDHRGPEFQQLGSRLLEAIKPVFGTTNPVIIYSSSGTGAWEGALTNTLSVGDRVLFYETGHFASLWIEMATRLGLRPDVIGSDWRHGVDAEAIGQRLAEDTAHEIKAVCCVHNETSTGVTSDIRAVREAIDAAGHPALLMVDTISGLASADYRHDEWGVDVTVSGSQKGLMLPPGLGFNAVSDKAVEASKNGGMPRSYWDWAPILEANSRGFWPTTPSTNLLFGLEVALQMLEEEGMEAVFARHQRHAAATRAAVRAWGLEILCLDERYYSPVLTAVVMPEGHDADAFRKVVLDRFDMSLGSGLGRLAGTVFRIGHLGWINDLTLMGTLAGVQMGLHLSGVPVAGDGVAAAMAVLEEEARA
ncbi:aminotransferase class V-fold PLP-dependent enzyme [Ornithinimicrobium humiphilum]|uniref:Tritium exchange subunit n=1 Tax=Ornithinimicrobium humiphilum TaxID=125288 RepID=A0A543KLB4_9MICO|nr:aminotransferase class V-fold PLP-dependent enzyme [Ornithinimicrobium humiphilum]TQM95867.1 alanine-glyoxylate transaminase/serine-glyoxylate transaminase/serine-pyruvate transaminase [Ornithinimicrobium humiphilum]